MEPRYAAFLSYAHASDAGLSVALRDALQSFGKAWYRPRALRVFRDNSSLSATEALWPSIQAALEQSRFLILLASPESAASAGVAQEVAWWLKHREPSSLLVAVTGGELRWDPTRGDFDRSMTTCLPAVLFGRLRDEPRWVDLRGLPSSRWSLRDGHFRDLVADLAAPLHGMAKDDLVGADIRQYRRTRRIVRATITVLSVLTVLIGASAAVAVNRAREADRQRANFDHEALVADQGQREALVRRLLAEGDGLIREEGGYAEALRLGLAALSLRNDAETRAHVFAYTIASDVDATLLGQTDDVRGLAYSPDGRILASSSKDHTIMLWDVGQSPPRRVGEPLTGHTDTVYDVSFSPDGTLLASAGGEGTVILWDVSDPAHASPIGSPLGAHDGSVAAAMFAPDRPVLATAGLDQQLVFWDISDPAHPERLGSAGYTDEIWAAAFSPDGARVATGTPSGVLAVWDVHDPSAPEVVRELSTETTTGIRAVAFHPGGDFVASAGFDEVVNLWDLADTATEPFASYDLFSASILSLAFSPDGGKLAVGGQSPVITVLDVDLEVEPDDRDFALLLDEFQAEGYDSTVVSLAYSPAGGVFAAGSGSGIVSLRREQEPYPDLLGTDLTGHTLTLAPDGHTLFAADIGFALWDVSEPERPILLADEIDSEDFLTSGTFAPDSRLLATQGGSDERILLWDVSDPAQPTRVGRALNAGEDASLVFLPDGRTLVTASEDEGVGLWDLSDIDDPVGTGVTADGQGARSVALSPDGHTLAVGSAGASQTLLFDATDPGSPTSLGDPLSEQTAIVTALAFSPDGAVLATGDDDGSVVLWDMTDPARPSRIGPAIFPDSDGIRTLSFAPDGHTLAMSGVLNTSLYDVSYPRDPVRLATWDSNHSRVTFTPDGRTFVVSGDDAGIRDYSRNEGLRENLVQHACARAGRGLDETEWAAALPPSIPYQDTCDGSLR